jgi:hypothetical protein
MFAALVAAKAIMLAGRDVAWTPWLPLAYFWQDVLVALVFGVCARAVKLPVLTWTAYVLTVGYVAINVPIALELSAPLSWPMIRAAGAPLSDSVATGLTLRNLAAIAAVIGAGIAGSFGSRVRSPGSRVRPGFRVGSASQVRPKSRVRARSWIQIAIAIAWIVIGAMASARIDTRGLHRNALAALMPSAVPVSASGVMRADWRAPVAAVVPSGDLRDQRGVARGQNVILIALESTAARYLGMYGAAVDPMPNLTRLSSHSIVFDRMYAVYPESIKGLYTTLCSRVPAYRSEPESYADAPCDALPQTFKDAGYHTGLFHSGRFEYLGMRNVIDRRGFDELEDAGAIGGHTDSSFGIDDASTVDRLLGWIDGLGSHERFFVSYLPIAGHHPYATNAPGPFQGATPFTQYLNALHESDAALGRLLDGLHARGRDRDTLLVMYGDHGEGFNQHDGNTGHTFFIYDENVHVPFVIAIPGWSDEARVGRRVTRVGSQLDAAPTILDLTGLGPQRLHQGVSLLDPAPRLALFYTDYSLGWLGLADDCWTFHYQIESQRSSLFDSCRDPDERIDRSAERSEQVRAYRERVTGWITSVSSSPADARRGTRR